MRRTRRTWDPNVLHKRLYSATLDDFVCHRIEFALPVGLSSCDIQHSALHRQGWRFGQLRALHEGQGSEQRCCVEAARADSGEAEGGGDEGDEVICTVFYCAVCFILSPVG